MEFKKLIFVLTITITILFSLSMGATYSWYAYSTAESNISGSTIKEKPTIIFAQTEYIKSTQISPIYDSDRYNYANKNSFTVTIGENLKEYTTGIEIDLTDISMSEELKIQNYKYELLENGNLIANGNFSNIGSSTTLVLTPMTELNPTSYPTTYNYELYIWLSETNENQNNLMNKGFSAKVTVKSAVKK